MDPSTLSPSEIESIRHGLLVWKWLKWLLISLPPISGAGVWFIFSSVREGVGHLRSMSGSLVSLEKRMEGFEKELGVTQAAVSQKATHKEFSK